MNGVIGMTSLMLETESVSGDQRSFAKTIRNSGEALAGNIE